MSVGAERMDIEPAPPLSEEAFLLFQKLLVEESGLYFDKDRSYAFSQAVWGRLKAAGCVSYQDYYNLLKFKSSGRQELRELIDSVTVGETFFFRHKVHFDILMKVVLPEIIQKRVTSKNIRIWSAGCSRGAEPYSIAMAVMEVLPEFQSWDVSILGTDVDRHALQRAREAVYTHRDVEQMPPEYVSKYFTKREGRYHLREDVKRLVRFEDHNLAKDSFASSDMQHLDVIFCRNVAIYFEIPTIKHIVEHFYDCLQVGGYLFIGYAETLWQITDKFKAVEFPTAFIYQKTPYAFSEPRETLPFMGVPDFDTTANVSVFGAPEGGGGLRVERPAARREGLHEEKTPPAIKRDPRYKEAQALFAAKRYDEALGVFNGILSRHAGDTHARFLMATILANQGRYKDALFELAAILDLDNLFADAYYLAGVLWYKVANFKEAEAHFRRAIYVDPGVVLSYFNLANVFLSQRKYADAEREFRNAVKILERMPADEVLRFSEDMTAELFLKICRNNLKSLEEAGRK